MMSIAKTVPMDIISTKISVTFRHAERMISLKTVAVTEPAVTPTKVLSVIVRSSTRVNNVRSATIITKARMVYVICMSVVSHSAIRKVTARL